MDLIQIEIELKKRWIYPYVWGVKQKDDWDYKTRFIYEINYFSDLENRIRELSVELKNYALNRWYNFHSAMAVEYIFNQNERVRTNSNKKDKKIDFYIDEIPFDHKTSVFPKGFKKSWEYAQRNPDELIRWLYIHQSQQGRKHLENRLFLVMYEVGGAHWKLKAEIVLIAKEIEAYLLKFKKENLFRIETADFQCVSDVIWISNAFNKQ